jgi:hypothetical protein
MLSIEFLDTLEGILLLEELHHLQASWKATIPSSDRHRQNAYLKCWRAMDEWQGKMGKPLD